NTGIRNIKMYVPILYLLGKNGLCFVLSIHLYNNNVSAGKKTITLIKLNRIPFKRFRSKSAPNPKSINIKAVKPKIVVDALAAIAGKDRFITSIIACCDVSSVSLKSLKILIQIIVSSSVAGN